jgi:hypothetical protein
MKCETGTYCPFLSVVETPTPASFYNPIIASDFYQHCRNGTHCATGSKEQTSCPGGLVGSSSLQNKDQDSGCIPCDAGTYSLFG